MDKSIIDAALGTLAVNLREWTASATHLADGLARLDDTQLGALGYSTDDVALIRTAVAVMHGVSQVVHGEITVAVAQDFMLLLVPLTGIQ